MPIPAEMWQLGVNAGIAGLLSLVVIYWYRVDSKERVETQRKRAEDERADKDRLFTVLTNNTRAQEQMAEAIRDNAGAVREMRQVLNSLLVTNGLQRRTKTDIHQQQGIQD